MSGILGAFDGTAARATSGRIDALNPVTRLGVALLLAIALLLTVDVVSAGAALLLELVTLAWCRALQRAVVAIIGALAVAGLVAGVTAALYGVVSGLVLLRWGLVEISTGSLGLGVSTTLRVLAIGSPAIVLFRGLDATALGDGLAQLVRLPTRFVLGAIAGMRLAGLFLEDWRSVELARRARGVGDRGRIRRLPGQLFAILVLAIRRGTKLATAMEARSFGGGPRTWARPSRLTRADGTAWVVAVLIVGISLGASAATGSWHWVVG